MMGKRVDKRGKSNYNKRVSKKTIKIETNVMGEKKRNDTRDFISAYLIFV